MGQIIIHERVLLAKKRLEAINWFSEIGNPLVHDYGVTNMLVLDSRSDALAILCDQSDRRREFGPLAADDLSDEIFANMRKYGIKDPALIWNDLADWGRPYARKLAATAINVLMLRRDSAARAAKRVSWFIGEYLLVEHFRNHVKDNLLYAHIMDIFADGHMVCGWEGDYPKGRLIVY